VSSTLSSTAILAYEESLARLILVTVIEATPVLGRPPSRGFVAASLVGSLRRDVVAADAHRLSTFGILSRHGLDVINEWIACLCTSHHLEVVRGKRGLVCTGEGRAFLDGKPSPMWPIMLLPGAVDVRDLDYAVRSGLVEALRRYRADQALAAELPEYRLFSEATLRELAARMPADEKELEEVPGMAGKRIAAHGVELLRIVAEHMPIIERLRNLRPEPGDVLDDPIAAAPLW
jgi:superfamily II DNA helicase RecQ